MSEVKFIATIDEDKIKEFKKLGINVLATEKDGFILPEIPRGKIWKYALHYADNVFGDGDKANTLFCKAFSSNIDLQTYFWQKFDVIFNKALRVDRTLNFQDACYCVQEAVDDTFAKYNEYPKTFPVKKTAKKKDSKHTFSR